MIRVQTKKEPLPSSLETRLIVNNTLSVYISGKKTKFVDLNLQTTQPFTNTR